MLDLKQLVATAKKKAAPPVKGKGSTRELERQKKLKIGKFEARRSTSLADIMRAIEEARKWEPQAVVLYVQRQKCLGCGEETKNTVGLFARLQHRDTKAMKMAPTNGDLGIDLYPREIKECAFDVPACPVCFKAQDLVEMVFRGIHTPQSGQLPLFNSML